MRRASAASGGSGHDGSGSMRWLLTYADLITLLLVFFIVLYSISTVSQAKYMELSLSLRRSFVATQAGNAPIQSALQSVSQDPAKLLPYENSLETMAARLQQLQQAGKLPGGMQVEVTTAGLVISFTEQAAFFQAAEATLQPQFQRFLRAIAPVLASVPNAVDVDGYTDNLPLHSPKFKDSWQLSARRATNVVAYLTKVLHLDARRFSAHAYGQYRPRYPNNDLANREKNRRVDLVVLRHPPQPPWGEPLPSGASGKTGSPVPIPGLPPVRPVVTKLG